MEVGELLCDRNSVLGGWMVVGVGYGFVSVEGASGSRIMPFRYFNAIFIALLCHFYACNSGT